MLHVLLRLLACEDCHGDHLSRAQQIKDQHRETWDSDREAAVREGGATLLPIDSEHNAIFQCLPHSRAHDVGAVGVRRILLTASGGPFRTTPKSELVNVTPDAACALDTGCVAMVERPQTGGKKTHRSELARGGIRFG